jgi:hypothetical protein
LIPERIWSRSEFDAEAIENLVPAGIVEITPVLFTTNCAATNSKLPLATNYEVSNCVASNSKLPLASNYEASNF